MSAPGDDDPYECLGISPGASLSEIRKAYKRAVQRRHPDRNPGNPFAHDDFLRVQWAYRVLLEAPEGRWEPDPPPSSSSSSRPAQPVAEPSPPPGKEGDATVVVHIPLGEAGRAQERIVSAKVGQPCPNCRATSSSCGNCHGTGQVLVEKKWRIIIPARTLDGTWLVGAQMGHRGARFGRAGDIRVQVRWTETGVWRWENGRLVGRVRLSSRKMRKGGTHPLRMPDGRWVWWTVPAGTVPGQEFQWERLQWGDFVSPAWIVAEQGWSIFSPRGRRSLQNQ